jgi:hypothetical protein
VSEYSLFEFTTVSCRVVRSFFCLNVRFQSKGERYCHGAFESDLLAPSPGRRMASDATHLASGDVEIACRFPHRELRSMKARLDNREKLGYRFVHSTTQRVYISLP